MPEEQTVDYDVDKPTFLFRSIEQRQWRAALARVKHSPLEASIWVEKKDADGKTAWKDLPIHQACQREPPRAIIKALLAANPGCASVKNNDGDLPIHIACEWGASVDSMKMLLMSYPKGSKVKNGQGMTPSEIVKMSSKYTWSSKEAEKEGAKKEEPKKEEPKKEEPVAELSKKASVRFSVPNKETFAMAEKSVEAEQEMGRAIYEEVEDFLFPSDIRDENQTWQKAGLVVVVVGASGDLAKKKTYPSLLNLFVGGFLNQGTVIWGYARSKMSHDDLRKKLKPFLMKGKHTEAFVDEFLSLCFYHNGSGYGDEGAIKDMVGKIKEHEDSLTYKVEHNRLFYFAIPPTVFAETGVALKKVAMADKGWTRIIVEKPFGRDLATYEDLAKVMSAQFNEETLYRIDHYLGKEMVQNLMILRFGNSVFERLWDRDNVQCIILTFKEPFGTEGRGGYFDQFGIIRDILQNHLLQVLTILTMECPVKLNGPEAGDKIRDAKVQVLNAISPIKLEDCVLGQYENYADDPTIENKETTTPTFAAINLKINNPRWAGVPIIMKAGKALDERKAEMRIQFKDAPAGEFLFDSVCPRNELVIRMQPNEAIYLKTNLKTPGFSSRPIQSELELNYDTRYFNRTTDMNPDAYTRLILDVLRGKQAAFVRDDELRRSWEIFTPFLHKIESEKTKPITYKQGSRGPKEADEFIAKVCGFQRNEEYKLNYMGK